MKKTRKAAHNGEGRTPSIHLEFFEPNATDVYIAGSFNQWQPKATPMISLGDGKWSKELTLPTGRYEYRFVVDGAWLTDPGAKELAPNPFGSANSVLTINGG
jgi:1,4-alpha-glucan branching enzyme